MSTRRIGSKTVPCVMAPCVVGLMLAAGTAQAAWPAPYYKVFQAGLTDAEHTFGDGSQVSTLTSLNAADRVIGSSMRYNDIGDIFNPSASAWTWAHGTGTVRLGYTDAEHTSTSDVRYSAANILNNAGMVAGKSFRYSGDSMNGQSAWVWSESTGHTRLGYLDAAHTGPGNYQDTSVVGLNEAGQAIGFSLGYDAGGVQSASSGWVWTQGGGTTAVGLTDAEHTRTDGIRQSYANMQNNAGRVIGASSRYAGLDQAGSSAWTWTSGGGHTRLGLVDADHTDTNGHKNSVAQYIDASGLVTGFSHRYTGAAEFSAPGSSAWAWSAGGGQSRIGFIDTEHTDSNGLQKSTSTGIVGGGQVVGQSVRYSGTNETGVSAWVWSSGTGTARVGLTDAEHTGADGFQASYAFGTPDSSYIVGTASRFDGAGGEIGASAWVWSSGVGTTRIGLTDSLHENEDGLQDNRPLDVNASGRVAGEAARYFDPFETPGRSVWTWSPSNPGETTRIGLTTGVHTANNGNQESTFVAMNDAGQIVGTSMRYFNAINRGTSGWFYDPATDTTIPLVFATGLGNRAQTTPTILTDSGLVLGSYNLYSGSSVASTNAFLWSLDNGFVDLGLFVDGSLSDYGWARLSDVVDANELAAIAGYGRVIDGTGQAVYILTVPAPATAGLLGLSGVLAIGRRRRAE